MDSRPLAHSALHPVGPLPPRVYWTRRLVLLLPVVVLALVIAVSCSGGSGGAGGSEGAGATRPTVSPSPTHSRSASASCGSTDLDVRASTDADQYAAGTLPQLTVEIRNRSATGCVLVESPSKRTWTIVSGNDQIWTTAGCPAPHTAVRTRLGSGATVHHTITWNRHRSDKSCGASTPAAPGTYQLVVVVNGIRSAPAVFHLTG